jgi:hypothetical protein
MVRIRACDIFCLVFYSSPSNLTTPHDNPSPASPSSTPLCKLPCHDWYTAAHDLIWSDLGTRVVFVRPHAWKKVTRHNGMVDNEIGNCKSPVCLFPRHAQDEDGRFEGTDLAFIT